MPGCDRVDLGIPTSSFFLDFRLEGEPGRFEPARDGAQRVLPGRVGVFLQHRGVGDLGRGALQRVQRADMLAKDGKPGSPYAAYYQGTPSFAPYAAYYLAILALAKPFGLLAAHKIVVGAYVASDTQRRRPGMRTSRAARVISASSASATRVPARRTA